MTTVPDETTTSTQATTASTTTTQPPTTKTLPVIGSGTYIVPDEVPNDTYRLAGYAARLDVGLEIVDNYLMDDNGFGIVIVQPTDSYLEIDGEIVTVEAFGQPLDPIAAGFTNGVYLVGYDIAQGRYRVQPDNETSYWARLDDTMDIIDNDLSDGATIVAVKDADFRSGVHTHVGTASIAPRPGPLYSTALKRLPESSGVSVLRSSM
jgi:hypothetical protein